MKIKYYTCVNTENLFRKMLLNINEQNIFNRKNNKNVENNMDKK